jgi:hypothetical protein
MDWNMVLNGNNTGSEQNGMIFGQLRLPIFSTMPHFG